MLPSDKGFPLESRSRGPQANFDGAGWSDVSVPIRAGMVHYPGNPPVELRFIRGFEQGDSESLSQLSLGVHTGTHLDAPVHFIRDGLGIDRLPIDTLLGPARVIEVPEAEAVTAGHLAAHAVAAGERILIRTRNSRRCWKTDEFVRDYSYLAVDAAQLLAERRVRLIGIDYLSIGRGDTNAEVHRILLGAGIVIVEGLDLAEVGAGRYDLICLPLRLVGRDGSPARALVRPQAA